MFCLRELIKCLFSFLDLMVVVYILFLKKKKKKELALAWLMSPQITTHRFVFLSSQSKFWHKRDRTVPVVGAKLLAVTSENPRYSLMS